MIPRGGNELPKGSVGNLLENCGTSVAEAKREQSDSSRQSDNGKARVDTIGTKAITRTFKRKRLLATAT